jgi:hypothetical protein
MISRRSWTSYSCLIWDLADSTVVRKRLPQGPWMVSTPGEPILIISFVRSFCYFQPNLTSHEISGTLSICDPHNERFLEVPRCTWIRSCLTLHASSGWGLSMFVSSAAAVGWVLSGHNPHEARPWGLYMFLFFSCARCFARSYALHILSFVAEKAKKQLRRVCIYNGSYICVCVYLCVFVCVLKYCLHQRGACIWAPNLGTDPIWAPSPYGRWSHVEVMFYCTLYYMCVF